MPTCDDDPCKAQGERKCSGRFEIRTFDIPMSSESEMDDIDDDNDDVMSMDTLSGSETEFDDRIILPTPREKLLVRKPLRRYSSSSYTEGLKVDEGLPVRGASQTEWESETLGALQERQHRTSSTDLGRLQGGMLNSRVSSRSMESRNLEAVKKASSNGLMSSSTLNQLDQRRYVSSLFLPSSPLVGENMKVRGLALLYHSRVPGNFFFFTYLLYFYVFCVSPCLLPSHAPLSLSRTGVVKHGCVQRFDNVSEEEAKLVATKC